MQSFIFEQYGYYPEKLISNSFEVDNWKFSLIEVIGDEESLKNIFEYLPIVRNAFFNQGPFLIRTRFGEDISSFDGKRYVLISVKNSIMNINDLNRFHFIFKEEKKHVDLNNMINSWKTRIDYIENVCLSSLRVDSVYYKENLEKSMFYIGMAQNSLQYLSEMISDYGNKINNVGLVHKRLDSLSSFDFFNPFNYVVDHPVRDLVFLYKKEIISFDDILEILEYYNLDSQVASYMVARIMYPDEFLGKLELNYINKKSNFKIDCSINKDIEKTKKIYNYFKKKYDIRPIEWLNR